MIRQHLNNESMEKNGMQRLIDALNYYLTSIEFHCLRLLGVISALSPNNKWERNLVDTELFLENPSLTTKVCTFFGQRHKALDIINHANSYNEVIEILGGEKTCSFYRNIMAPSWSMSVTVDLWMYRAAKLKHTAKNYALIAEATSIAAREKNIQPHQYQAIVWSVIRK